MNCSYMRTICMVCILAVSGTSVSKVFAGPGLVSRVVTHMAMNVKKILPTKAFATVALCVAGCAAARALWTRCITLKNIDQNINPEVKLYIDRRESPIYNWMMGASGFTTPAQIRSNLQRVKDALAQACLSGQVAVFQYRTGNQLMAGNPIYWADVLSSIDNEIITIRRWMNRLEPFVDITFRGIHLFGIRRNFVSACDSLCISGLDQIRHAMTTAQETQIEAIMTEGRGIGERVFSWLMANPNYDKAYSIFWELDQRIGRLQAIKEAVVSTPINWHVALH